MGHQRSRQISTVATLDSNGTSSRTAQTGNNGDTDKENAELASSSKHRYPCRSRTTIKERSILGENGGSRSKSAKNPNRGKRFKCPSSNPGEDAAPSKRTCVQIRDGCVENHNVKTAERSAPSETLPTDGNAALADPIAVQCDVQGNVRSHVNNTSYRFALNYAHDDRVACFANGISSSMEGPDEDQSSASVISKIQEIYSKLHLKYRRLKELKFGEVEKYIEEQNRNLTAYVQAQQELLEHIRMENNLLKLHADQPNITMTLNRLKLLEQENIQRQSDLLDQHTKNIELKNEVRRLESLLSDHVDARNTIQNVPAVCQSCEAHCLDTEGHVSISQDIHSKNQGESNLKHQCSTVLKESLQYSCRACGRNPSVDIGNQERKLVSGETTEATDKSIQPDMKVGLVKSSTCCHQLQNDACEGEATGMAVGILQRIVGFKITVADEGESPKLVFLHQSSGYSFQLKCANHDNYLSEDEELAYQVISFGTLHKVIPDWMKEEIIFNISQVGLFFDRLLHVVNGRGYQLWLRR